MQRGFSLIELLIVTLILAVLSMIAIPLMLDALNRARVSSLATDARAVYLAFQQYYVDASFYPDSGTFALDTFEPLVSQGYYTGTVGGLLVAGQADGYDSPDSGAEFWLEMSLASNPSVRFLVAHSDDAPLGSGDYHDGIYYFYDGVLTQIPSLRN
jgi:prepilin-type N-terminal cleavage/methylation domain-containing protein